MSCLGIHHPWRERKQGSPSLRRSLVEQPQARPTGFSLTTIHCLSTRITAFIRLDALFTIVHDCSRLFTIVRYCSAKKYCPGKCPRASGVLVGPHGWPACLTTRRTHNELMPGKENVLDGANRGTFDIALTLLGWYFVRHEGRRSPTIRSQARTGAQT